MALPEEGTVIKAQRESDPDDLIHVGQVVKAHGIRGEVKVFAYSGVPDDFAGYSEVTLVAESRVGSPTRITQRYAVTRSRSQMKFAILQLDGITDRNQAEALQGFDVWVSKDLLPEPEEGDYSWNAVQGLRVVTEDHRELGTVSSMLATGADDLLVVTGRGREYLIPANPQFIASLDREEGTIVIIPVPGLLEINE